MEGGSFGMLILIQQQIDWNEDMFALIKMACIALRLQSTNEHVLLSR
jgi:hypothetical protein